MVKYSCSVTSCSQLWPVAILSKPHSGPVKIDLSRGSDPPGPECSNIVMRTPPVYRSFLHPGAAASRREQAAALHCAPVCLPTVSYLSSIPAPGTLSPSFPSHFPPQSLPPPFPGAVSVEVRGPAAATCPAGVVRRVSGYVEKARETEIEPEPS